MVESQIKTQEDIDKKITALKADPTQYTSELKKSIIIDITFSLSQDLRQFTHVLV